MIESEGPLLVDTGSGLNVRYHNRNLYSPASPILAAEKRADVYTILPQTLLFVPSPLLFYGIDHLLARIPEDVHLLCVEADQALMRISLKNSPQELVANPLVHYLRTDSIDEVLSELHELGIGRFRRCLEIVVNGGRSIQRELYSRMYRAVEYEIQGHWRNRITLMHMAHLWIKNYFVNLPEAALGGDLAQLTIDQPIVVAGAGESLERAVPMLKKFRGKYYLLAVDTAVRTLVESGLAPDAVVILDAQAANLSDLIGFEASETTLIADVTAYPECIRRFSGEKWFFFSDFADLKLFSRARSVGLLPAAIPPLGSVGIAALYFAHALTAHAVVFVGLDFSYQAGKTHARGAPSQVAAEIKSSRLSPTDAFVTSAERPHRRTMDKSGAEVWTDSALSGYSSVLRLYVAQKERIFDLGGSGLATPAPRVDDELSLARILERRDWPGERSLFQREGNGSCLPGSWGSSAERLRSVRSFLERELIRLKSSVTLVMETIGGAEQSDAVLKAVEEEDFVYLHFPDSQEESYRLSDSFLKRFVEAAETSEKWIRQVLSRLSQDVS